MIKKLMEKLNSKPKPPILKKENLKRTMPLPYIPLTPPPVPRCMLCGQNPCTRNIYDSKNRIGICEKCFSDYINDINRSGSKL